eukprot:CAMPEP_0172824276 /NCGR_PEP_ID=MMETSP1075-20121228/17903_1 /TAXON_ID=2916 /ORGANISM="Ceratium fusus, Strain PA161109" /LENGTH=319 /DNA_ID=CAMNT_0013665535 /DNA_START=29 /DNA_END=988 /DNA_ORIENTATION=+
MARSRLLAQFPGNFRRSWAAVVLPRWQFAGEGDKSRLALACVTAVGLGLVSEGPWGQHRKSSCEIAPVRSEPTDFNGKTAVVTGAASGIGLQVARRLVVEGAHVVLVDRDAKSLEQAALEMGGTAQAVPCDLRDLDGTGKALEAAGIVGKVDMLVNCAGVAIMEPFFEITQNAWDTTMDVNVRAMLFMSKLLAKGMVSRGGGTIVNISSQSSTVVVGPNHTCYSASKATVDHITQSIAINLAADNVRCNAVNPTVVRTNLAVKAHGEEGLAKMAKKIPLQRICQPDNVADAVLFLLSDRASMITGVSLPVDGGFLAARP